MREILFRGKRLDNGEWIYGYYAKLPHPITAFLKDYIIEVKFDESDVVGNIEYVLVDPETVGQFTGLLDKNGNKIFEGDILKEDFWDNIYVVFYSKKHLTYMVRTYYYLDDEYSTKREFEEKITDYDIGNWVIIGNIHDNKELFV